MLIFATSDKGGTGRSVTSCNLAYRLAANNNNVAYLDFDFGSPTAGALFEIAEVERGVASGNGLHSYLLGHNGEAARVDVRRKTSRRALGSGQRAGKLVLLPGDQDGAEFSGVDEAVARRCAELFLALESEFRVTFVDLSAGRSAALQIALRATAMPQLQGLTLRWLVFHRWTRQHILAASGLVHGEHGILRTGTKRGHDVGKLEDSLRYVRTAVPTVNAANTAEYAAQAAWLQQQNAALKRLASKHRLGPGVILGETPMEPMLQWREQIILDADVNANIANAETTNAFGELARKLVDDATWERF